MSLRSVTAVQACSKIANIRVEGKEGKVGIISNKCINKFKFDLQPGSLTDQVR